MKAISSTPLEDARGELTRQWLAFASDDLQAAERASHPPPLPSIVAFHAQQATEKAIKGFLIWNNQPFRKTHVLVELLDQCTELDLEFGELVEAAETLTPYAVMTRYPDDLIVADVADAMLAGKLAEQIVSFVRARLPSIALFSADHSGDDADV
ncbi:MAG: HEPN domain-containing protein [Chloroflexota bacterium]